jgi:cytochrome c
MRNIILVFVFVIGVGLVWLTTGSQKNGHMEDAGKHSDAAIVNILMPEELSETAKLGEALFNKNCATCHGQNAVGQQGVAPPLVHKIYEPSHHGDQSFQMAVAMGVRSHHWKFGNMPAIEGLSREDVFQITQYVRDLQRANGIF